MGSGSWSTDVYDAADALPRGDRRQRVRLQRLRRPHRARRPRPAGRQHAGEPRQRRAPALARRSRSCSTSPARCGSVPRVPADQAAASCSACCCARATPTDPQILFGAIGDATCDRVPLQIGQFESDNRMDDDLGRIVPRRRRRRPDDRVLRAGACTSWPGTPPSTASRSAAGAATCSSSATRWPYPRSSRRGPRASSATSSPRTSRIERDRRRAAPQLRRLLHPARPAPLRAATSESSASGGPARPERHRARRPRRGVRDDRAHRRARRGRRSTSDDGPADLAEVGFDASATVATVRPPRAAARWPRRCRLALDGHRTDGLELSARMDHVIVVDLGFGDAGKGTVVDCLCATADRSTR